MRFGGRVSAAIDILEDISNRHRPASEALSDWGRSHRFAGSGDRAAIGNIVYDALRNKASTAWRMGDDGGRALVLGTLVHHWGENAQSLATAFADDTHAPDPPTDAEVENLSRPMSEDVPAWILGDYPEWLHESLEANFGEDTIDELRALAARPPTDFRCNTLKSDRTKLLKALKRFDLEPTKLAPHGLRFPATQRDERTPNIQPEAAYQKGWIEVQDEGSQIVSHLIYAQPGEKVLDYCAGAGGKTLALSSEMNNTGQIFAYDADRTRLAPIYDRLKRAGTRNVQVRAPKDSLEDLLGKMDRVVVDAPCTGSGVWRRRPDAKWRLSAESLVKRLEEQVAALHEACAYVRPGGYLCYITCSILAEENEGQVYAFLEENNEFQLLSAGEVWEDIFASSSMKPWSSDDCTVTLTPASTETDGFFFAVLERDKDSA